MKKMGVKKERIRNLLARARIRAKLKAKTKRRVLQKYPIVHHPVDFHISSYEWIERLRTKIMSPQHSSLPTTNLSPSNPIYGSTVMTSSSSITTSNAKIPTQTQTLAGKFSYFY